MESQSIFGYYVVGYAAALVIGALLFGKFKSWPLLDRLVAFVLPSAVLGVLVAMFNAILHLPFWIWNAARLAPAFALRHGDKLYSLPGEGPELNFVYGPLTPITYLPATIMSSPTAAITFAGLINIAFYCGPILWLYLRQRGGNRQAQVFAVAAFCSLCFLTWESSALTYSAFSVHSDALAMGWAAVACAMLYFRKNSTDSKPILWCAVITVIALWTKLIVVTLPLAIVVYLLIVDGRKSAMRYVTYGLAVGVPVSLVLLYWFGAEALIFKMLKMPSSVSSRLPPQTPPLAAVQELVRNLLVPAAIIGIYMAATVRFSKTTWLADGKRWLTEQRWTILLLVGVSMIPLSVPHRYGHGGSENALSPPVYFILATAMLLLVEAASKPGPADGGVLQRAAKSVLLVALVGFSITKFSPPSLTAGQLANWPNNPQQQIFEISKRSPGQLYFPDFPLAVLMGEGKLYHFSFGIADLDNAGFPLSPEGMHAYMPTNAQQVICMPFWVKEVMKHLPEYSKQVPGPPGMQVYQRP